MPNGTGFHENLQQGASSHLSKDLVARFLKEKNIQGGVLGSFQLDTELILRSSPVLMARDL